MKIQGTPGPDKITVTFEDGKFKGKSVTMGAEPIVGGVVLYASTIKRWDGLGTIDLESDTRNEVIQSIRIELKHYPPSEIIN